MEKLADILQSARYLKDLDIFYQIGSREVIVEIAYASDEGMGSIVIKGKATKKEICRRETNKTEVQQKIIIK